MSNYLDLSGEVCEKIKHDRQTHAVNPYAFRDEDTVREYPSHDVANLWRPAFVRDIEKIIHNPYYNRYSDKTQVFSLYRNDDISRRAQHVQLVSRIARNIGSLLNLNTDLIEAISLGHDIGHTPFGHAVERKLSEINISRCGKYFNHNIQSARVFTEIFPVNMSLQTLDGIICHNGELELKEYRPQEYHDFRTLRDKIEKTYTEKDAVEKLVPATLEGCVMRVSDIIAYVGKDRHDASKLGIIDGISEFEGGKIGKTNAEIINNMIVNIVEKSYGKPYLSMDDDFFEALKTAKKENYSQIYKNDKVNGIFTDCIYPMLEKMYDRLRNELVEGRKDSVIYRHHINYINEYNKYYKDRVVYEEQEPEMIVTDYIASMTDDYFVDLYHFMFPNDKVDVKYVGYFD